MFSSFFSCPLYSPSLSFFQLLPLRAKSSSSHGRVLGQTFVKIFTPVDDVIAPCCPTLKTCLHTTVDVAVLWNLMPCWCTSSTRHSLARDNSGLQTAHATLSRAPAMCSFFSNVLAWFTFLFALSRTNYTGIERSGRRRYLDFSVRYTHSSCYRSYRSGYSIPRR